MQRLLDFGRKTLGGLPVTVTRLGEPLSLAPDARTQERIDMMEIVDLIHRDYDQAAERLVAGRGDVPLCRDGCGKCCMTNVPRAAAWEAVHTISTMSARGSVGVAALQRARDWLTEKHPAAPTYPRVTPLVMLGAANGDYTREELAQIDRERMALESSRCPFLDDAMRCTVYEARPMACRTYGVTVTPDDFCERPKDANELLHPGSWSYNEVDSTRYEVAVNLLHRGAFEHDAALGSSAFWPTVLYAHYDPEDFQRLVARGEIAAAKLGFAPGGGPYAGALSQSTRDTYAARAAQRQAAAAPIANTEAR